MVVWDESGTVQDNATEFKKTMYTFNAHFISNVSEPYKRHVFQSMPQAEGESVDKFVDKPRKQAQVCNSHDNDSNIYDQVIENFSQLNYVESFGKKNT